ncbi:MAG TPA: carbon storage regulator CsrA [Solirubrobacteraceae bacterium]
MLNITRRRGERVVLGDDVFISILEVSGQTVRLGIDAPRSVRVYREEIWLEVKRENEAAAQAAGASLPTDLPAPLKSDAGESLRSTVVNPTSPPSQT